MKRDAPRVVWALALTLLVVAPVLDLAWNEPALDEGQGMRCQLHANPVVALEPLSPLVALAAELLLPFEPLDRFPLVSPLIFIPPRA
jgi:hypothetical protein